MSVQINDKLTIYFPLKLKPRDQQLEILKFTADSINKGMKYIMLNAPTGCGKSYYVIMFINWYLNNINQGAKFDILTNSKVLQDQYLKDFPFMKNLKGKSNYICDPLDTDCEKGLELCKLLQNKCDFCPYKHAIKEWMESQISLTNFHMFNTFALYVPEVLDERKSNVLILDEAHGYEENIISFLSIHLSAKFLKKYGFEAHQIEKLDADLARIKTIDGCLSFIENKFLGMVVQLNTGYSAEIKSHSTSKNRKKDLSKYIIYIEGQITKFEKFISEFKREKMPGETEEPRENWVLDIEKNQKEQMFSGIELVVQPVWAYPYLKKTVFNLYDHVIFMSGTILDRKMFSFMNGLDVDLSTYMDIESPFSVKLRPIYFIKCGKMVYNLKKETFKVQKEFIKKIMKKHKQDKGIIHAATYEISEWVKNEVYDNRLVFHETKNRSEMLEKHLTSKEPTILVSPSMTEGLDLKFDLSRFQIILKIQYPNISSNKVKQRQKTNKSWYNWATCCTLIQAYGRSIRSTEDEAKTYILDSCLLDLMKYSNFLPRWFTNAIKELKI